MTRSEVTLPYSVPRKPDWHVSIKGWACTKYMRGACAQCEPCLRKQLRCAELYIETLRDECRRLGR